VKNKSESRASASLRPSGVGLSAVPVVLIAAMPKCPLCWMALMSAIGLSSTVRSTWMRPLAATLLFLSISALFIRARRRGRYAPFYLGLVAACALYFLKFTFQHNVGVYLSAATLLGASIWNALSEYRAPNNEHCGC
jgi:hypothetical protein